MPKRVALQKGNKGNGWGDEEGGCCLLQSCGCLQTETNLCPDELECDKNAGLGGRAEEEEEVQREGYT